jgi:hypothetical protein
MTQALYAHMNNKIKKKKKKLFVLVVVGLVFLFSVLGLELKPFTLNHSTNPFL